jgi:hypothetical protein
VEEDSWSAVPRFSVEKVGFSNCMLPSSVGSVRVCLGCWSLDVGGSVLSVATRRWNKGMGENLKVVMVDHDTV